MKHIRVFILLFLFSVVFLPPLFCQDQNAKIAEESKKAIESKDPHQIDAALNSLKEIYFKDDKYSDFVDLLKSLRNKNVALGPIADYYIALSRYEQLAYLEKAQDWNEYFSQGDIYREELESSLMQAIDASTPLDKTNIYAKMLLWKFHQDKQDSFAETALSNLIESIKEYSKDCKNLEPIRETADSLSSYEDKTNSRRLYKLYVDKLVTCGVEIDKLPEIAEKFYEEGNLDLSENIYDVYIDRIKEAYPKEKILPILKGLAEKFSYKDKGANDPYYAEKLFTEIENLGSISAFDQELIYLRAFNLEKSKEFRRAKEIYLSLAEKFPESQFRDEAIFKAAAIETYLLRNPEAGKKYFEELAEKNALSPQVISALYQLGILSQWDNEYEAAQDYFNKLLKLAGDNFSALSELAKKRLEEINEGRPLEHNLNTLLDTALAQEYSHLSASKVNLVSSPSIAAPNEEFQINSTAQSVASGCTFIQLQYLWSGDLGESSPQIVDAGFSTSYKAPGTKIIGLVVTSPNEIIDRTIDFVDVK